MGNKSFTVAHTLTLHLKRLGKKRVKTIPLTLPENPRTLSDLLAACVSLEVDRYNRKQKGEEIMPYLLPAAIDDQLISGKISFGGPAEKRLAELVPSIAAAELAFNDGLFAVFVDETQIKSLDQPLGLTESSVLTFMRLTFLVGTYW